MLEILGLLVVLAALTPWLEARLGKRVGWLLAAASTGAGAVLLLPWLAGGLPEQRLDWVPSLGVGLALRMDGLAAVFVVLITLVGSLVLLHASSYLEGHARRGRVLALLLAFLVSMLGLVLADDLVALFLFWELTSITSFLLIGTEQESAQARRSARQALLVTGAGGLALLLGFLLLARMGSGMGLSPEEAMRISRLLELDLPSQPLAGPALVLVLLGAFTKSAQVPFHFWLPAAMAAPTPVSALLHSATMVKAGVYLLARLHPGLGDMPLWIGAVTAVGAATMLTGAVIAPLQRDLKTVLAWSTVSVLGVLTMLLGVGTDYAIEAAVVFLVAHALYKAALFLVAGNVDHGAGTRDLAGLGGLRRAMPWTAAAGVLAALSKAGAPPMFGFVGKELLYKAKLDLESLATWLVLLAVVANVALVASALLVGVRPFFGTRGRGVDEHAHDGDVAMLVGPVLLAGLGIFIGLVPATFDRVFGTPMASAIAGHPLEMKLKLWHGIDPTALSVLALSAATLGIGGLLYRRRARIVHETGGEGPVQHEWLGGLGPARGFEAALSGLTTLAGSVTLRVQHGSLTGYLRAVFVVFVAAMGTAVVLAWPSARWPRLDGVEFWEMVAALLALGGALLAAMSRSRLGAVAGLGATGTGVTLLFAMFSAPDLAITQIMVETLTVVLFVLVLYRMPPFTERSRSGRRVADLLLALAVGAVAALAVASAMMSRAEPVLRDGLLAASVPEAKGRNVVNVVLVDFRGLDTLGEIVVVAVAGLGVLALLRHRLRRAPSEGDRSAGADG